MLGSRKLLIVLCIVPCVLSLVCIGAFAASADDLSPSVDFPIETEVGEDVVKSPSVRSEETFPAQPLLEYSYYSYSYNYSDIGTSSATFLTGVLSCSVYRISDGSYVFGKSFEEAGGGSVILYRAGTSLVWSDNISYTGSFVLPYDAQGYTVEFIASVSTEPTSSNGTVNGTLVDGSLIPDIADSVFDLGDALISFVVSSWVVILPLAAWLVILCIGSIRKLVKGV